MTHNAEIDARLFTRHDLVVWFHSRFRDCTHSRHVVQCEAWADEFLTNPPRIFPPVEQQETSA